MVRDLQDLLGLQVTQGRQERPGPLLQPETEEIQDSQDFRVRQGLLEDQDQLDL